MTSEFSYLLLFVLSGLTCQKNMHTGSPTSPPSLPRSDTHTQTFCVPPSCLLVPPSAFPMSSVLCMCVCVCVCHSLSLYIYREREREREQARERESARARERERERAIEQITHIHTHTHAYTHLRGVLLDKRGDLMSALRV